MKKQIANIITGSRILGSIGLICCPVFSASFYGFYLFCGVTDMIDGTIARKLNAASESGARLDTAADMVFLAVCFAKMLPFIQLPVWGWIWTVCIAILKVGNMIWGFISRKKLLAVHSVLNKAVGFLLFLFPLTLDFIKPLYSSVAVCFLAMLAAIEEWCYISAGRGFFRSADSDLRRW